jgi:predicted peroxiredoxin
MGTPSAKALPYEKGAKSMSERKTNKLVVVLGANANDDKSTVAFTIANAALSTGMEVAVFLTSDAVELARDGGYDMTMVQPFKKLEELVDSFVEKGGTVWACTPCYKHRGMKESENVQKVIVTGAGPLIEWVQAGAATICL